jgi:Flp pilus assembly protein TadG
MAAQKDGLIMGARFTGFAAIVRGFVKSRRGNVAMIFALSIVPLMVAAGAGLDYARAMLVRQQMGEALDAAALAVGSTPNLTQSSAQTLAQKYFDANYTVDKTVYGAPTVSIPSGGFNSTGSVQITATDTMPTVLMKLASINNLTIATTSNVVWGQTKLWVALVLDNSGSMSQGDANGTKMDALKSASSQLLTMLQNAASTPGDVKVGIVPFTRSANIGKSTYVGSSYIDWGEWDGPPANITSISSNLTGGGSCPFSSGTQGFRCTTGSSNGSSSTNTIPSSGLICPGADNGTVNTFHNNRYYNGCWDSVPTATLTTTQTTATPSTLSQTCTTVNAGATSCDTGTTSNGTQTTNTSTQTTSGYSGDSTTTSSATTTGNPSDGSQTCTTNKKGTKTTCTWTRTTASTTTDTTVTKTGTAPYSHTWHPNAHSSWGGCVTDRQRSGIQTMTTAGLRTAPSFDMDSTNTQPSSGADDDTKFPAENPTSTCPAATVTTLNYDWTSLSSQINAMQAAGSTNQGIGVSLGWQMVTTGNPFTTPSLPANTARYIILLSDGLNTQNRWWGDGSTENTTQDGYIDTHEKNTCDKAKADGVVIYTIFLDIGGTHGNSAPLLYCASDSTKYFDLTSTSAVVTAFNQIGQQITNVRVAR